MDFVRYVIALSLFCLGIYLIVDLFVAGFDIVVLGASILSFILAHYIKPKKSSDDNSSMFEDSLDFVIDLPFKAISVFLRTLSRTFKDDSSGFDID